MYFSVFCPPGWHPTRSACMKVVETATGMTYNDAKTKCTELDMNAYPTEPYNEYLQTELTKVVSNSSLTETVFWIGMVILQYDTNISIQCNFWVMLMEN